MEPTIAPQKAHTTPKDFFLNLGAILALYIVAASFLSFIFTVINTVFADRLNLMYDPYSSTIRLAVSTLVIIFPILMILGRIIYKDLFLHPEKRELALRKWLIYLTLFVTGITIAVDLIVLLNTFLSGEVTTRFILKVLAVFVTAGIIFWYYISDLRGRYYDSPKNLKIFSWVVIALVAVSVIGGFLIIGSPVNQRDLRDDSNRVNDLSSIQWQIVDHYQKTGALPASLADLNDPISSFMVPTDPKTNLPYEYAVATNTKNPTFSLCATFALKNNAGGNNTSLTYPIRSDLTYEQNWSHESGRTCFTRTIDPLKYPINPAPKTIQ